jgi:hypothetical protein
MFFHVNSSKAANKRKTRGLEKQSFRLEKVWKRYGILFFILTGNPVQRIPTPAKVAYLHLMELDLLPVLRFLSETLSTVSGARRDGT